MKYFITYLLTGEYRLGSKVLAKSGVLTEVPEDVYIYLTNTFGDRGWFTFKKKEAVPTTTKATKTRKKRVAKQVNKSVDDSTVEQLEVQVDDSTVEQLEVQVDDSTVE